MRTYWVHREPGARTMGYRELGRAPLSDSLQEVLATADLVSVTLNFKDGTSTNYSAIEYTCEACGEYGHENLSCICQHCKDWVNIPQADHPATCPECGEDWS